MITMLLNTMLPVATTIGIGAPQFNQESARSLVDWVNIPLMILVIIVLWKSAFGKKVPTETVVSPTPLKVQAHEEYVTSREFREVKARTIALEKAVTDLKDLVHATEMRIQASGHEREEKLMSRINDLVPEIVRAVDRTEINRRKA